MHFPTAPGSFWLDRDGTPPRPPLSGNLEADVVVVGGGIAGACVARALVAAGRRVVVLEADRVGRGASGRNAGFVLAEGAATSAEVARKRGDAAARALRTAGLETRAVVADIAREALAHDGLDVGLRWTGSLRLAGDAAEMDDLSATARSIRGHLVLERDVVPAAYRGLGFAGGLVDPDDGVVHPLRLVRAALAAVERAEGLVFDRSAATHIEPIDADSGRIRVVTPHGVVGANDVVVTTNAWISRLLPDVPVRPMRAQMLAARVDPAPDWAMPVYSNRGAEYWRQLADGTVLLGGRRAAGGAAEEGDDAKPAAPVQPALDALLAHLLRTSKHDEPPARGQPARGPLVPVTVRVTDRWAGTMGFTADEMPIVGEAPGQAHVWVLGGFHGHGMGWGPGLASRLAAAIASGAALPAELAPTRPSLAAVPSAADR